MGNLKKKVIYSWVLWFIPIIPAMWEAKIRRITVGGQLGKQFKRHNLQNN
jgi:hypothetical protein